MTDKRGGRTPKDMALSLLVLIVPVILIMIFYRGLHGGDAPVTVDPTEEIARAGQAGFSLTPQELPEGWQVATARFDGRTNTLRLGYLTRGEDGLQLVEAKRPGLAREELTTAGEQTGTVNVEGVEWQVWTGREKENALVLTREGVTVVISGRAAQADLVALAEHLL
ncbi:hypothetical protein F4553_005029 [Allocatelliglobosispora scoriae]|uniref:DUF4245 domain-containing protein n=1 Tax=Allocatelliglobosispora scoriae TaxID=643052 RepID=A0A841BY54_9ACTN|nr:DUF4245 domain-containing protein [Allocatelliglobosispora scoriae]MBB5871650.1 hypothetical protein [Allocatelliglobosispora scoriae]